MIGDTWTPTLSISTMKYLLADAAKYKAVVHQLYFIGAFLQADAKHRVFLKLDSRYGEYFTDYANYFERPLRLNKSTYEMNSSGKLFSD